MKEIKPLLTRKDVDKNYIWKLDHMYPTDEIWQIEYDKLLKNMDEIQLYQGKLSQSADILLECLQKNDSYSLAGDKLYVYANMKFHEDSTNSIYQTLSDKSEMLTVEYYSKTAFIIPEILEIPEKTLQSFIDSNIKLQSYTHFLENIIRQKQHSLSSKEEELLAQTDKIAGAAQNIFVMINDADIKFPNVKNKSGDNLELTKGRYVSFLESSDRILRKSAFKTLYQTYLNQKNTLAATYYASVKKDVFYASIRNYSSALSAALDNDKIPVSVYDNLIETVHKYLPLLHKYVKLRKKILGIEELHMYDLYTPLVPEADMEISYENAKKLVSEGLTPLGEDYIATLKKGFQGGWIDVYENIGKRGGAYSWGAYSSHPYVLLNHNDTINSTYTLAHEMGHALHSFYTWQQQPYHYSGHKIFVAEVASTVNEALLMDYMLSTTTDKKTKNYLMNYFMEQFRGTLFRQTMFAEFEKITHDLVEKGEPLNCDNLMKIYHDLNLLYYGEDIIIDEEIDIEWARIPHFYNAFYVYQYATGYSAAITLSKKILTGNSQHLADYLNFLSKGNSEYSIDLLKGAGVDMTTPQPLETAMTVFEDLLNQMEKNL